MLVCWLTLLVRGGIQAHSYLAPPDPAKSPPSHSSLTDSLLAAWWQRTPAFLQVTSSIKPAGGERYMRALFVLVGYNLFSSSPFHIQLIFLLPEWADYKGSSFAQTSPSTPTTVWGLLPLENCLLVITVILLLLTELKLITMVRQTFLLRNRWISISIYFLFLKISPNNFDSHFSYEWCRTSLKSWKLSHTVVSDSAIPWTVACQAPLSLEFSRQESWSGFPFPPPGRTSLRLSKCLLRASPGGSTVKNCTTMQETVG